MTIHLLEPFLGGSHQQWAEGLKKYCSYQVNILGLPARHWKWRMHGASITLARQDLTLPAPDVYLATDMLDLATFKAIRNPYQPCYYYFHENQLTYPWSPTDKDVPLQRDRHYGWINYTSAVVADKIAFNSTYHRESFLAALPDFLQGFPDFQEMEQIDQITEKSIVLPLGLDLPKLSSPSTAKDHSSPPILLWNHRWEYDKNPQAFFGLCYQLLAQGIPFQLIVIGEQTTKQPPCFTEAKHKLAKQIVHWGYVQTREEYWQLLQRADILPVTSHQDFFGISTVEAIHAGCFPILPNRLAFPQHIPMLFHPNCLYSEETELFNKIKSLLQATKVQLPHPIREWISRYNWLTLIGEYEAWIGD